MFDKRFTYKFNIDLATMLKPGVSRLYYDAALTGPFVIFWLEFVF